MPKISDLFTLKYGHSLELNRLARSTNAAGINFVGRAARNNGVTARVTRIPGLRPAAAGTISVALGGQGGAGVAFLQPEPYYCGRDVMILTAKKIMTEQEKLWWALCITTNRYRFGFGRQANRTLKDIILPDKRELPGWVNHVKVDIYRDAKAPHLSKGPGLSDRTEWRSFTLNDLFDLKKGHRLTKADMQPGDIPYIGASDRSNGVTAYIGHRPRHLGGTITVSYDGSVGEAFFQPKPFWASDAVNVLYPKAFTLNASRALFVCTLLRREKYRFSYGRKWHLGRMMDSRIRLPVRPSGKPDWDYIERFIRNLAYSSVIE